MGLLAVCVGQGVLPLGHSLSPNNLGENLSIFMTLAGPSNRKLKVGASDSTLIFPHHVQQGHQGAASGHQTRVIFDASEITISPDSVTGESAVDFIPDNFNVTSVRATGHTSLNLPESLPVNINLSNTFFVENE